MKFNQLILLLFLGFTHLLNAQQSRIALVIGNSAYPGGSALKNPVNDANLMASTLSSIGFEVIKRTNANKSSMDRAIYDFTRRLATTDVALFYYAGHGMQVDGTNYLIPIDAKLVDRVAAEFEAVDVSKVVKQFERHQDNTNIVILDACRNDPFRTWSRGGERGFSAMPAPSGTLIAFATSEGSTAADGAGANGLFTSKLVQQIRKPQRIEDVFIKTRVEVQKASNNAQSPQEWSQLTSQFYFVGNSSAGTTSNVSLGPAVSTLRYGTIELNTQIGGTLYLDGQSVGQVNANTRVPIRQVTTGYHTLSIKGTQTWNGSVEVFVNRVSEINVSEKKSPTLGGMVDFQFVQGGSFTMGSEYGDADEKPVHTVSVSSYEISKYPITVAQFRAFVNATGYITDEEKIGYSTIWKSKAGGGSGTKGKKYGTSWRNNYNGNSPQPDNHPVIHVSWNDAVAYTRWLSERNGEVFRLPTEAEWEFACKGGLKSRGFIYAGSNTYDLVSVRSATGTGGTEQVGTKLPNELDLYDMSGQVWEWVNDKYSTTYYATSPKINPQGAASGTSPVMRGGSWYDSGLFGRCSNRTYAKEGEGYTANSIGFRVVRVP